MTVVKAVVKKTVEKTVTPPSSPFGELLRRSRFATFDPSIRQTYYTPPEAAHRGDWGLKRPLSLRRKNAFISIPAPFDSRAQYIEWSNAENEVRFIRRFEEMEVSPKLRMNVSGGNAKTSWEQTLGTKNSTNWVIDSEFAFREEGVEVEEVLAAGDRKAQERLERREEEQKKEEVDENLTAFGLRGPGQYGMRRKILEESAKVNLTPNIYAMSPKEFSRYVRKLRELRPQFQEYVKQAVEEDKAKRAERQRHQPATKYHTPESSDSADLLSVAQNRWHQHHVRFLEHHTASSFADPQSTAIEQRPHQVGGLLYARLSPLHSHLHAQAQPGIVLQASRKDASTAVRRDREDIYVASLAGMTPLVKRARAAGKRPLLDRTSEQGITRELLGHSIANMRLVPNTVVLENVPRTVGPPEQTQGVASASISSEAVIETERFDIDNPYMPGTMPYSGLEPPETKDSLYSIGQEKDELSVEMKKPKDGAAFVKNMPNSRAIWAANKKMADTVQKLLRPYGRPTSL
ncbi:hypothetical protein AAF712_005867 [Marasmius tenuissimus]|uniref:Uncharacterized protein n=1 Tax=Marasmius tenuissimus TaxID=585030 RepID=A0ABR2ZZE3_9AGAR